MVSLLQKTKNICSERGLVPSRSKGQNFLIKEEIYEDILRAAKLKKSDTVLEVGPGLGFLTVALARKVKKVVAVELDDDLYGYLKEGIKYGDLDNIELRHENILDFQNNLTDYKIVANLPYNISSVFLRRFLSSAHRPTQMVLMLQKEVAERASAKPGEMSLLGVSIQFYAKAELVEVVPSYCFWPEPKVDSAILRLTIGNSTTIGIDEKKFFRLTKIGFSAKRKMLKNNLAGGYRLSQEEVIKHLSDCSLSANIRAQDLSLADWIKLLNCFEK